MIPFRSIDRTIPTPLYYQLQQMIKRSIESGELKPGDSIPTEQDLVDQYGLSRATVRQAILQLVNEGYLRRQKSKGTFVTSPPQRLRSLGILRSFSAELDRKGIPHSTRILDKQLITATERIGEKLQIGLAAPVYYVKRLRHVDGSPYLIDEHYIPSNLCPGIEERYQDNASLYGLLETQYGLNLHHGQIEFQAAGPTSEEEAELLEVYPDINLLYVERVVYNEMGVPVDYFEAKIHGRFTMDIVSTIGYE